MIGILRVTRSAALPPVTVHAAQVQERAARSFGLLKIRGFGPPPVEVRRTWGGGGLFLQVEPHGII